MAIAIVVYFALLVAIIFKHKLRIPLLISTISFSAENIGIHLGGFYIVHFAVALIIFLFIIDWFISPRKLFFSIIYLPILLIDLLILSSFFKAINLNYWLHLSFDFLNCSIIFYLVTNLVNSPQDVTSALIAMVGTGLLIAFIGIGQFFFMGHFRVYSLIGFNQANTLAGYLMLIIPFTIAGYLMFNDDKKFKRLFLVANIILVICLLMTQSRGGAFAFIGVLLISGAIRYRANIYKNIKYMSRVLIVGLLVWFISLILFPFFNKIIGYRAHSVGLRDMAMLTRYQLYYAAINMIKKHPIFGIGFSNFIFSYYKYGAFGTIPNLWSSAHNIYLQTASEMGVVGFVLFFGVVFGVMRMIIKCYKLANDRRQRWWTLGLLGSACGLLIHGFVDSILHFRPFSFLLWALFGLAVSINKIQSNRNIYIKI